MDYGASSRRRDPSPEWNSLPHFDAILPQGAFAGYKYNTDSSDGYYSDGNGLEAAPSTAVSGWATNNTPSGYWQHPKCYAFLIAALCPSASFPDSQTVIDRFYRAVSLDDAPSVPAELRGDQQFEMDVSYRAALNTKIQKLASPHFVPNPIYVTTTSELLKFVTKVEIGVGCFQTMTAYGIPMGNKKKSIDSACRVALRQLEILTMFRGFDFMAPSPKIPNVDDLFLPGKHCAYAHASCSTYSSNNVYSAVEADEPCGRYTAQPTDHQTEDTATGHSSDTVDCYPTHMPFPKRLRTSSDNNFSDSSLSMTGIPVDTNMSRRQPQYESFNNSVYHSMSDAQQYGSSTSGTTNAPVRSSHGSYSRLNDDTYRPLRETGYVHDSATSRSHAHDPACTSEVSALLEQISLRQRQKVCDRIQSYGVSVNPKKTVNEVMQLAEFQYETPVDSAAGGGFVAAIVVRECNFKFMGSVGSSKKEALALASQSFLDRLQRVA